MTWQTTTLGRAGDWVSGGTPSTSAAEYWGGDIPWMSSKSMTEFKVRDSDRRLTPLGAESGTRVVGRDTILMVVRGMSLKSEFRMGITHREVAMSQDLKALVPSGDFDPLFLAYAIKSRTTEILEMVDEAGHGTGRLQTDRLLALEVPVPPLAEQRAIAATLGSLDDRIESNRRAIDLENKLAAAILSAGEVAVRVGDIASASKGLSYKGANLEDGDSGGSVPMLNLANFGKSGQMHQSGTKHYSGTFKQSQVLSGMDLLVANTDLTQNREILGRAILVPPRFAGAIHTHHTTLVRFGESAGTLALFLWAQMQSQEFRDRAQGYATGTTVCALPAAALLDFEFSIPVDAESVAAEATRLLDHSWQLESEVDDLTRLRDALLPELLSGRIRLHSSGYADL